MTCQHCQTWILDDDHRCRRCGRRVRSAPHRISPNTYPIAATATALAATATAPAYQIVPETAPRAQTAAAESKFADPAISGQQSLFAAPWIEPRIIPFDSLTTQSERESIRARAAEILRPAPVKTGKVEQRPARPRKTRSADQRWLDFQGQEQILGQPQSDIICDAPVAPPRLRMEAGAIDASFMVLGSAAGVVLFVTKDGGFSFDRHVLWFFIAALATVPLLYKLLWTFAGRDTPGMQYAGLRLVDFDGHSPSKSRRYHRMFGSLLSVLAAGIGLIWSFVDEDGLTWHDHISGTFPTLSEDTEARV